MGNMKTAMQDLKEDLQKSIEGLPETLKGINDVFVRKTVTDAVLIAYNCVIKRIDGELLEKEKQQIIDAVTYGQNNHTVYLNHDKEIADRYYNETFKQE